MVNSKKRSDRAVVVDCETDGRDQISEILERLKRDD